jgi:glycerol-3-phosphate acyltransferase PlsY
MLFGIEPISISISSVVFIAITFSTRYVSLASITASFIYPISLVIMRYGFGYFVDGSIIIFATFIAVGIIYKHKSNIRRLLDGNENQVNLFGKKTKEDEQAAEKLTEAEA